MRLPLVLCLLVVSLISASYFLSYNRGAWTPGNNSGSMSPTYTAPLSSPAAETAETTSTEAGTKTVEPLNIAIMDQKTARLLRPVEYYELGNGSVVRITDRNLFPFTITLSLQAPGSNSSRMLPLYRVSFISAPKDVLQLARSLGINTSSLLYNDVTRTYLYSDENLSFEYTPSTGFFRVIYRNPRPMDYKSLVENRILPLTDKTLVWRASRHLMVSGSINGTPIEYTAVYTAYLNDVETYFSIVAKLTPEKLVSGLEGVLPGRLELLGKHSIIVPSRLPALLRERIKGEVETEDWYISKLGFTALNITEIRLQYMPAGGGLIAPVYRFKGSWKLEYDVLHAQGQLTGLIVAVTR